MHLSRFKKTQLLVGIFSIWKQLWIELEKKLLVIYNTLENPSALLDIILYAWLSSSYECNGIRPCILHPFLNLFFYLSYLGGQQWNSTLCVWCTHLDILQSLEFFSIKQHRSESKYPVSGGVHKLPILVSYKPKNIEKQRK